MSEELDRKKCADSGHTGLHSINRLGELCAPCAEYELRILRAEVVALKAANALDVVAMRLRKENESLRAELASLRAELDLWKRQAAFESEHREKYRTRAGELLAERVKMEAVVEAAKRFYRGDGKGQPLFDALDALASHSKTEGGAKP